MMPADNSRAVAGTAVTARARANIALVKYWGKRPGDPGRNLPAVGSFSITLDGLETTTTVTPDPALALDEYLRDGEPRPQEAARVIEFMDRLRAMTGSGLHARIETRNNFPTGAGLASSASGFAALAKAASRALDADINDRELSMLARDGSGSAARSICGGYVRWHRGETPDGSDSFAEQAFPADHWPLRVVVAVTAESAKETGSKDGMLLTQQTSPYFDSWVDGQSADLAEAEAAVAAKDFDKLAEVSEFSCLKMHAAALAARPGLLYWNAGTLAAMQVVRNLRAAGTPVFFTIDAGPQLKAVCLPEAEASVQDALADVPGVTRILRAGLGAGVEVVE